MISIDQKIKTSIKISANAHAFLAKWIVLMAGMSVLSSCEDVIEIDLDEGKSQLVIDAWLTDEAVAQKVELSLSGDYLGEGELPKVTDAQVMLMDENGRAFAFEDADNDGVYTWQPTDDQSLISLGNSYTLSVSYEGQTFQANSAVLPVAPIDSLTAEFREENIFDPEGYFVNLWARDLPGVGNTYWIRTYKNGEFFNRPEDITLAYDAAFSPSSDNDGLPFIFPIRESVNPDIEDEEGNEISPYSVGDTVKVEIYSLTNASFDYLTLLQEQLTATSGLFAVPLPNLPSNFENVNPASEEKALGFFGTSAVSSEKIVIEEVEGEELAEGQ